jgi:phenylalanyl-tRNA synthetase beta subunit
LKNQESGIEVVEVTQLDGSKHMYSKLSERKETIDMKDVNNKNWHKHRREKSFTEMRKKIEAIPAVHISNRKTLDFQVVRTTLLAGLLKTVVIITKKTCMSKILAAK